MLKDAPVEPQNITVLSTQATASPTRSGWPYTPRSRGVQPDAVPQPRCPLAPSHHWCTHQRRATRPATSQHFLLWPTAQTTKQAAAAWFDLLNEVFIKRGTFLKHSHTDACLCKQALEDRWETWSPFPPSQRTQDTVQPQATFRAHRNTESLQQRQGLNGFKGPSHWPTAGGKRKQKTKWNPDPCALPSTPRRCCIKLRH